jgi:type I restriction enzyme R subunit
MNIGQSERETQNRIIALFRDELHYTYLGDWRDRDDNTNIEQPLLAADLTRAGYSPAQIAKAIYALRTEADNQTRGPYANNEAVYKLLRYGVSMKT